MATPPEVWPKIQELTRILGTSYELAANPEKEFSRQEMMDVCKSSLQYVEDIADILEDDEVEGKEQLMSDSGKDKDDTVVVSVRVVKQLVKLNRDAKGAVSLVGGNSVQDGYRDNTTAILDKQYELLEVFDDN